MRGALCRLVGVCAIASTSMSASSRDDPTSPPLVGLLRLPTLLEGGCPLGPVEPLALYRDFRSGDRVGELVAWSAPPDPSGECYSGKNVDVVRTDGRPMSPLPTLEFGYEQAAAIVTRRRGSFRIATATGPVWVAAAGASFMSVRSLLTEHGSLFLRRAALDALRTSPDGARLRIRTRGERDERSARVVATVWRRGRLWLRLRFDATDACGQANPPGTPRSGWAPFAGTIEAPSVWFYSRGC